MSGECNYCGGEHAEQACDADRAMVYRNGYASGEAAGSNELYPQLTRLRAECERLTRERDEARNKLSETQGFCLDWKSQRDAALERARLLAAECGKGRAILGPFGTLRDGIIQEDGLMYEDARSAVDEAGALGDKQ